MAAREKIFRFESEAAMCAAFIEDAERQGWTAYPETGGFDIVLVHNKTKRFTSGKGFTMNSAPFLHTAYVTV